MYPKNVPIFFFHKEQLFQALLFSLFSSRTFSISLDSSSPPLQSHVPLTSSLFARSRENGFWDLGFWSNNLGLLLIYHALSLFFHNPSKFVFLLLPKLYGKVLSTCNSFHHLRYSFSTLLSPNLAPILSHIFPSKIFIAFSLLFDSNRFSRYHFHSRTVSHFLVWLCVSDLLFHRRKAESFCQATPTIRI